MSKYLYILDNGHGNDTKGKRSPLWGNGTQLLEYDFNRGIVKYLSFMLRQHKIDCEILVPELNDISLKERVKRANELAKKRESILISVHGNAFGDERVNGFETHCYSDAGSEIAKVFQKRIGKLGNNRGVKYSNFYILKHTSMPAILTENGFYSNEIECKKMLTNEFQYEIANEHLTAILKIESA